MGTSLSFVLPIEMQWEIIQKCDATQLRTIALVAKEWEHSTRIPRTQFLMRDIKVHFYRNDNNRIYMNWSGRITFGSTFFRGTRVHLHEDAGSSVTIEGKDHEIVRESHVRMDNLVCKDDPAFWSDFMLLRFSEFDQLFSPSRYQQDPFFALLRNSRDVTEFIDNIKLPEPEIWDLTLVPFKQRALSFLETYPKGVIYYEPPYSGSYGPENSEDEILFIRDHDAFLDECRRIKAIGEQHDVSFCWV
jgi:hypothetical protein